MSNDETSRTDAQSALVAFQAGRIMRGQSPGDDREAVTDLITDLLHLVDSDSERFDEYDGGMVADTALQNHYDEAGAEDVDTSDPFADQEGEETCGHGTWLASCREAHGVIRGSLPAN